MVDIRPEMLSDLRALPYAIGVTPNERFAFTLEPPLGAEAAFYRASRNKRSSFAECTQVDGVRHVTRTAIAGKFSR
jgi:hypothetical protein